MDGETTGCRPDPAGATELGQGAGKVKIATIILRSLMGLLFLFSSITYLFNLIAPPPLTGAIKTFHEGLEASVYLLPTVKTIELVCGIAFVVGRFVPLATVLISPIIVNIVLVHAFMAPEGLPVAAFLVFANAFVAYYHRERYKPLFKA
jgi:putative oxidoreductase